MKYSEYDIMSFILINSEDRRYFHHFRIFAFFNNL